MKSVAPNINAFWADLIVEELIRNGVDQFCLAPGSRSAPLALAVASNPRAKSVVHFDERGLAYFALGRARGSGRPVAVVTTSGTAAANLLPAVVEASMDGVSLVLLTADRPPEPRDTGANQTIDQVKLFGAYVCWSVDLPCPDASINPRMVLTTVDQAVHRSGSGPVHINCMFREPLDLTPDKTNSRALEKQLGPWRASHKSLTSYSSPSHAPSTELATLLKECRRGLVTVGALQNDKEAKSVARFAERLGWPVFPDVLSGLRLRASAGPVIHHADLALLKGVPGRVDAVLHIGGRLVSKRMAQFIETARPRRYIVANDRPDRMDASHSVTHRIECSMERLPLVRGERADQAWHEANRRIGAALDEWERTSRDLSEPLAARLVSRLIPSDHALFLGNSMPVRDMNMFGCSSSPARAVFANRGASGIDGTLASGLGCGSPATILIGDLAMLHDLNSLALARERKAVIVVLNNNGGGIFSYLPVAGVGGPFERFFGTPHGLSFEAAADLFGVGYVQPRGRAEFEAAYRAAGECRTATLIEVRTGRTENVRAHRKLQRAILRAMS
jgi:2-succinyl-5-enolpyruvyl-6-hydroxy-3-cyclohexene-1-carboxylate synthase